MSDSQTHSSDHGSHVGPWSSVVSNTLRNSFTSSDRVGSAQSSHCQNRLCRLLVGSEQPTIEGEVPLVTLAGAAKVTVPAGVGVGAVVARHSARLDAGALRHSAIGVKTQPSKEQRCEQ